MGQTQVPGPGHYDQNADSVYLSSPQNSFPKAGREALNANERQNFPGPGQYPIPKSSSVGTKFGKGNRSQLVGFGDDKPGPGKYAIPSIFEPGRTKKGITMSKRPEGRENFSISLGPGAYDPKVDFVKKSATTSK